jgi:hypothetical protein
MVVRTIGSGRDVTGLYIGTRNARRHFPRKSQHIELQLGHLQIYCDLPPEFWKGRPEICDARLSAWLFSRIFHGKQCRTSVPVAMIPLGKNAFRVLPFTLPSISANAMTRIATTPAKRAPETR